MWLRCAFQLPSWPPARLCWGWRSVAKGGAVAPLPPAGGNGGMVLAVGAAGTAAPWARVVRPSPALCWGRAGGAGAGVCRGSCRAVWAMDKLSRGAKRLGLNA